MSNFTPSTPLQGFNIPVPSGWVFIDKGTECFLERQNGEAVRFKVNSNNLDRYCTKWEFRSRYDYKTGQDRTTRVGLRKRTDGVLEWLVNQK